MTSEADRADGQCSVESSHGENEDDGDEEYQEEPACVTVAELIRWTTGRLFGSFVHSLLPSWPGRIQENTPQGKA